MDSCGHSLLGLGEDASPYRGTCTGPIPPKVGLSLRRRRCRKGVRDIVLSKQIVRRDFAPSPAPGQATSQATSPRSGFTMIEVLAVLLIFMILLGMVLIPASTWHRQQRIRSGIAVVQTTLRLAREYAITRQETVSVTVLNQTDPRGILRSYYWMSGPSGDMSFTNTIPKGVCFHTDVFDSTNGITHVLDTYGSNQNFLTAVFIAGDPDAEGDWIIFTTNWSTSLTFTPNGTTAGLSHIGIAETDPPGKGIALTGIVAVTRNTGYITAAPTMP